MKAIAKTAFLTTPMQALKVCQNLINVYSHFSLTLPSGLDTASYKCLHILSVLQGYSSHFFPFIVFFSFALMILLGVQ